MCFELVLNQACDMSKSCLIARGFLIDLLGLVICFSLVEHKVSKLQQIWPELPLHQPESNYPSHS